MITGIIAAFIGLVVVIPAFSEGNIGAGVLAIVIALFLLFFEMVSRADDRAQINRMDYWSHSGKERAMMRHKWEAEAREEEQRRNGGQNGGRITYEQLQAHRGLVKAGNSWTAGKVGYKDTTHPCPTCGSVMHEDHRVEYSSGAVFVTYICENCRKELPVKVK